MESWSENIRILAKRHGGQEALGKALGVNQGTVSKWVKGTIPKNPALIAKAADLAGVAFEAMINAPLTHALPRAAADASVISLPVMLPSAAVLETMLDSLLRGVGLDSAADEHAGTLAQRLPGALAQAAAQLANEPIETSTIADGLVRLPATRRRD